VKMESAIIPVSIDHPEKRDSSGSDRTEFQV
jgi:hypothetical protein